MRKLRLLVVCIVALILQCNLVKSATVMGIIASSDDHDTLEIAIIAAGLDGTLSGPGPFTVFAPTDNAFKALPEGLLDTLLADPAGDLADILLYHVIGDSVVSTDLTDGMLVATLLGNRVEVSVNGGVFINDAEVTVTNLTADNGVVHVIDAVLTPSNTVVDIVEASGDHDTLEIAIEAAELRTTLMGDGPFTVFAPTDNAFKALPEGLLDTLLAGPAGDLANILLYHVVGDSVVSKDLSDGQVVNTLLTDKDIKVAINGSDVMINDAKVTVSDLTADNGVVHIIDAVLIPKSSSTHDRGSYIGIEVFPNPASDRLSINLDLNLVQEVNVKIVNISGITVRDLKLNKTVNHVDIGELQVGSYMLVIQAIHGDTHIEKLLVY